MDVEETEEKLEELSGAECYNWGCWEVSLTLLPFFVVVVLVLKVSVYFVFAFLPMPFLWEGGRIRGAALWLTQRLGSEKITYGLFETEEALEAGVYSPEDGFTWDDLKEKFTGGDGQTSTEYTVAMVGLLAIAILLAIFFYILLTG